MKKGDRLTYGGQRWIAMEDYLALHEALKEALQGWLEWMDPVENEKELDRIEELQKRFLDP